MNDAGAAQLDILLFDGVCNLCNGFVGFVIRRDPEGQFRFAALQSEIGQQLLHSRAIVEAERLDSLALIDRKGVHLRSSAALHVIRRLGFPWSLLYGLIVVPRPIRDFVYRWIARNRYRLFGRREQCMVPTPELRSRFLE